MKCGSTASILTFIYLSRLRQQLKGKLTLVMVSDEETFGPWGARYLLCRSMVCRRPAEQFRIGAGLVKENLETSSASTKRNGRIVCG